MMPITHENGRYVIRTDAGVLVESCAGLIEAVALRKVLAGPERTRIYTSHHGARIEAVIGRTVLHYRDGYLQNDHTTEPTEYDAQGAAAARTAAHRHYRAANHRFAVASI